jgi:aldehyde:ferredoxin oxidoreductase
VLDDARGVPCMAKLVSGLIGREYSVDELVGMGVQCLKDELDFNKRAGFTDADDQLPRFFRDELLPPHNVGWDFTAEELQGAKV